MLLPHFWAATNIKTDIYLQSWRKWEWGILPIDTKIISGNRKKKKKVFVYEYDWNSEDIPDDLHWCQVNNTVTVKENWTHEQICATWQITHNEC